jgi:hypothetical protein
MSERYELHSLGQFPKEDSIGQIQCCLDAGADINLTDDNGETALS